MKPLTQRQSDFMEVVRCHWRQHGSPPSVREIASVYGTSHKAAQEMRDRLIRKGHLMSVGHRESRAVVPVGFKCRPVGDGFMVFWSNPIATRAMLQHGPRSENRSEGSEAGEARLPD